MSVYSSASSRFDNCNTFLAGCQKNLLQGDITIHENSTD